MIKSRNESGNIVMLAFWVIFLLIILVLAAVWLYSYGVEYRQRHQETPATQINNTTAINNYYYNETEFHSDTRSHTGEPYSGHIHEIEPFPYATPALWNDTRRESVGLPADGFKNPCPCKTPCTPTPTPACEFPWWCTGGERR